jgi:hypothetical protein
MALAQQVRLLTVLPPYYLCRLRTQPPAHIHLLHHLDLVQQQFQLLLWVVVVLVEIIRVLAAMAVEVAAAAV